MKTLVLKFYAKIIFKIKLHFKYLNIYNLKRYLYIIIIVVQLVFVDKKVKCIIYFVPIKNSKGL